MEKVTYYEELLTNRFGKVGTVMKDHIQSPRFPVTYHHDFVRGLIQKLFPDSEMLSRGDVGVMFRGEVPNEEEQELELIKGAIGYVLEHNEGKILEEILDTKDLEIVQSYASMKEFMEDIWLTKLKS